MNDKFNPLEQYNRDMEIIDVTTTSISNAVIKVAADSENNYSELKADINVNTASISAMKMRLVNAEDDIKVNKEESEKAINALQVTTSSISATIMRHIVTSTSVVAGIYETIDTKYEELKTQQLADEQRIAVNETAIANHQELLDKLNLDSTETGDAIEELQEAVQALQNVDSSTAESIQDLRTRMSSAEANILTGGTDIDALEARMTTAEENIEDLQNPAILNNVQNKKLKVIIDTKTYMDDASWSYAIGNLVITNYNGNITANDIDFGQDEIYVNITADANAIIIGTLINIVAYSPFEAVKMSDINTGSKNNISIRMHSSGEARTIQLSFSLVTLEVK